jgi:GEVED domain/Fibronectin type III domain
MLLAVILHSPFFLFMFQHLTFSRWRLSFAVLLGSLGVTSAWAQVATNYTFSQSSGTYTAITGGTVITTATANTIAGSMDSYSSTAQTIPFTFTFNGSPYTTFYINGNGYLTFGTAAPTTTTSNQISTTTTGVTGVVSAFAGDLNGFFNLGGRTTEFRYEVTGTAPNRVAVIQFKDVRPAYSTSATTAYGMSFQIRLAETSNAVSVVYGPGSFAIGSTAVTGATNRFIGLRGTATTDFNIRTNPATALFAASTASASNLTGQSFNTTAGTPGMPASGLTYTWALATCSSSPSITSSAITTSGATMTWTVPSIVPVNGYQYEVRTSGAAGSGATGLVSSGNIAAGTLTTNLTGLASATSYTFYLRSDCSAGGFSSWSTGTAFTTLCDAISTFPWTESFEGATIGTTVVGTSTSLPNCWNSGSTQWSSTNATTYNTAKTGTKYIRYVYSSTNVPIYTPAFQLTGGVSYDLSFFAQGDGWNTWTNQVLVNTTASLTGATTLGAAFSPAGTATGPTAIQTYAQITRAFVPATTGTYYFMIRGNEATGSPWYMAFDDFMVRPTPTCVTPSSLAISAVTTTTATATWTAPTPLPTNGYQWEVRTSGVGGSGPGAGFVSTGTTAAGILTAALTGLTANTTYSVYVRADCGAGDISSWSSATTFYTGYCLVTATATTYFISNFTTTCAAGTGVTNLNNTTTGAATGYTDYTALTPTVSQYPGSTVPFSTTIAGASTQGLSIFIDWNNNLVFDATEKVYGTTGYLGSPIANSFTVPVGQAYGAYRMRVAMNFNSTVPTACATAITGEYEDYTFNVVAPPPCAGTPAPGNTIASVVNICTGAAANTSNLSLQTTTIGTGVTYQWQSATTLGGTYADIAAATAATYTATVTATTAFRCNVICAGSTGTSTPVLVNVVDCGYNIVRNTGITYNSVMNSGSTYATLSSPDDGKTNNVALTGTTFKYQGQPVTGFYACSNGWMTFNTANTSATYLNDLTTAPNMVLAPFWDDLVIKGQLAASKDISMRYQVIGTLGSGSADIVIEWAEMERYQYGPPNINFQVILHEAGNVIDFNYGNMQLYDGSSNVTTSAATISPFTYTVGLNGTTPTGTTTNDRLILQLENTALFAPTTTQISTAALTASPECNMQLRYTPAASYTVPTVPAAAPPVNDNAAGAITLPVNIIPCTSICGNIYSSKGATATAGIAACTATTPGNADDDVWFKFTTTAATGYTVGIIPSLNYDAVFQVLDASFVPVACYNAVSTGSILESVAALALSPNTVYYLRVYDAAAGAAGSGEFAACVSETILPPVNDNPSGAIALTVNPTFIPTNSPFPSILAATATATPAVPPVCTATTAGTPDDDVWYSFTTSATAGAIYTIQAMGASTYNPVLQLFSGAPAAFTSLQCANTTGNGATETITDATLLPNTTYYLRVYHSGVGVANGSFTIAVAAIIPNCITAPTAPADGSTVCPNGLLLSWPAVSGATSYDVYLDQAATATTVVSAAQTGLTYAPAALLPNLPYAWKVVPKNANGDAIGCSTFTFNTLIAPNGDSFADPVDLTAPGTITPGVTYTTTSNNFPANCWSNQYTTTSTPAGTSAQASPDVFYKIHTGKCTDRLVITTCGANTAGATGLDTELHLLDVDGVNLASNDAIAFTTVTGAGGVVLPLGCTATAFRESGINQAVLPDTDYFIVVEGFGTATGNFDLNITELDVTPFTVASAAQSICVGAALNLTATPTGAAGVVTYAWEGLLNGAVASPSPVTASATTANSDLYTVTATDAGGCTATTDVVVTVNELPTVDAGADINTCTDNTTSIIVTGVIGGSAITGTWSHNGGGTLATTWDGLGQLYVPAGADLTGLFPKNITITLTTTLNPLTGNCAVATDNLVLTIYQCPDLVTTPAAICVGQSIDLSTLVTDNLGNAGVNAGVTTWYPTLLDAGAETNALASTTVSPIATTTYYVRKNTTTTTPECRDVESVVITVNPLPTITLGLVTNVCSNATSFDLPYTATTNAPTTYSIAAGATGALAGFVPVVNAAMPAASPFTVAIPAGSAAGTYNFDLTVKNANTCLSVVYPFTVTIQPLPTAAISYTGTPFCTTVGSTAVVFTGTNALGGTYTAAPATGLTLDAATGAIDPSASTGGTYVVTYTVAASGSCPSVTASTSVTITPLPTITALSYVGSPFCSTVTTAEAVTLTGTHAYNVGTYTATPTGLDINATTGAVTPSTSTAGTYTVTYTIASAAGCAAVSSTATVVITPLPTITALSYVGTPFCKTVTTAEAVTLTGTNAYSVGTYTATPAGLTLNATTGAVTPSTSTAGTYTVTYTIAAATGCAAVSSTATVVITPLPTATIVYPATPYCTTATSATVTETTANVVVAGVYSAAPAGLMINAATGEVNPSTSTAGTYTVTYTIAAASGCASVTATTSIVITNLPTITAFSYATPFCTTVTTAQAATLTGTDAFTGGTFAVSPATGLTISATGAITPSTSTGGTYVVTYTTPAGAGCGTVTAQTTVVITPLPTITALSYVGSPFCSTVTTAEAVTLTGTHAYNVGTYTATPTGLDINATTGAVTPSTSTAGTYTVTYTIASAAGCAAVSSTATVVITPLPTITALSYVGTPFCKTVTTAEAVTLTGTNAYSVGTYTATPAGLTLNATTGAVTPSTSTAGTYTVTYTIAAATGCAAVSSTATVVITPLPTATIVYPATPYCTTATSATVTETTANVVVAGVYSAAPAGLMINAATGEVNPSTSTAGTYTVTYTIAAASGCASVTATTSIVITNLPTITAFSYATPFCTTVTTAQAATLTGTDAFTGGTFAVSPATGLTISATGAITPSTSTGGTYVVTYTTPAGAGCGTVTAQTTVVITPLPTITALSYAGSPFCSTVTTAEAVTLSGTHAYSVGTYTATPAGLMINATTGAVTPSTSTAGTYTVTYTIASAAGCAAVSSTATVVITPLPTITALSYVGTPFCKTVTTAEAVTLTGTNAYSVGTYTATPAGLTLNATTGAVTPSTSTAGTYTVTYTIASASGCAAVSSTATVVITPLPTATISYAGTPFCTTVTNAPVTATTANVVVAGVYSAAPAGLMINASTGAINASTSTAGTYTVTYTVAAGSGCASVTATTTVVVTQLPTAALSYSAAAYCKDVATAAANLTGTNAYTGGIFTASPAGLTISSSTGDITPSSSTAGTYTVTYTTPAGVGCGTVTAVATVTINALPVPAMTQNGPITCALPTVTLNASTSTGPTALAYAFSAGATATTLGQATVTVAGTYTVTVTTVPGCTATTTVAVTGVPTAPNVTATTANVIDCINLSSVLTATATTNVGPTTYAWSTSGTGSITGAANAATATAANAGIYTVVVTANGCQTTATVTVVKNTTTPVISIAGPSAVTCLAPSITLTASGTAATYVWNPAGTGAVSGAIIAAGTYTVTATATANGCTATATKVITLNNTAPVINIMGVTTFCAGTSNTVMASPGFASYAWSNGGGTTRTLTVTSAQATTNATYTVTVTAVSGCSTTRSVTFTVNTAPTVTVAMPTVCAGSPLVGTATVVTATPAATVTWIGPNGYTGTGLIITRANANTAMNGTYIARATNSCGTRSVGVVATVRNTVPITVAIQNASVLGGSTGSATVTAPAGCTFSWTGPNGVTGTTLNYIRNKPAGSYVITVTQPGNPCTVTRTIQIQ